MAKQKTKIGTKVKPLEQESGQRGGTGFVGGIVAVSLPMKRQCGAHR